MPDLYVDGRGRARARARAGRSAAPPTAPWSPRSTRRAPRTPRRPSPRRTAPSTTAPGRAPRSRERGDLLLRVADLLERDTDEVARMESLDTGKRLVESEYDVADVVSVFRHYGRVAAEEAGRVVDTGNADVVSRIVHEPVGVCGLITPWNYPLLQVSWKVAPCLAAGNTFVLKPSELTPALRDPPDAPARGGRAAGRRRQPGPRRRGHGRRAPGHRPARRPGLVHRRGRDRPPADGRGRRRRSRRSPSSSAARTPTSSSPTRTSRSRSTTR